MRLSNVLGWGRQRVRSIVDTLALHGALEKKLAAFKGVEATLSRQASL
jgi:hypothetical protein